MSGPKPQPSRLRYVETYTSDSSGAPIVGKHDYRAALQFYAYGRSQAGPGHPAYEAMMDALRMASMRQEPVE